MPASRQIFFGRRRLFEHLGVEVQMNDDGTVSTTASGASGRCTVEQAVAHWLDSDEGQAFRPKPATHEEGPLQQAVQKLRSKLN